MSRDTASDGCTLHACLREHLFRLQVSTAEVHEQVLAIVRDHETSARHGSDHPMLSLPCRRASKESTASGHWHRLSASSAFSNGGQGYSVGAFDSHELVPIKPPALPLHPSPPREICDRDRQLEESLIDSFLVEHEEEQRVAGKPTSASQEKDEDESGSQCDDKSDVIPGAVPEEREFRSESTVQTVLSSMVLKQATNCSVKEEIQYKLLPIWLAREHYMKKVGSIKSINRSTLSTGSRRFGDMDSMRPHLTKEFYQAMSRDPFGWSKDHQHPRFIIHPTSVKRGIWDFFSVLLVVYDMIFIPMQLFDPEPSTFTTVCAWTTRLFWTFDIGASFITAYVRVDGSNEFTFHAIARRYIKTWFALDLVIVVTDWVEIFWDASGGAGYARVGKASRIIRIIRMVRLLRFLRIQQVIKLIIERINSERIMTILDLSMITIVILGFAHFMACIWYGISAREGENTWVSHYKILNQPLDLRYACSLHWSLSQFTGGMDEFVPQNINERIFAIIYFLLAFLLSVVFVSALASSMTHLNIITSSQTQNLNTLRKYLLQNKISKTTAIRVQRNATFALKEQQRFMAESQVAIFTLVSEPLRVEVHFEMYSAVAKMHPFFERYVEECPQVMRKVCHSGMSMLQVAAGDIVFSAGEIALTPRMFFVCIGSLQYIAHSAEVLNVEERTWLSEAVIWTTWMHRGQLSGLRECRICVLEAPVFQQIVSKFEHPDFEPRQYADAFIMNLNEHATDALDLPSPDFNFEAAVNPFLQKGARSSGRPSTRPSMYGANG